MNKDYYKILGVSRTAAEEDIKRAYRKLAHQHHPDKQGGDEKKFKEINEAYQILSNKDKRAQYDRFGQVFEGGAPGGGNPFEGFSGDFSEFGFNGFGGASGGFNVDLNDILEGIFGQFGGHRYGHSRGADAEMNVEIGIGELFLGKKITIADAYGETFSITVPPGFSFRERLKIPGRGMRGLNHSSRGDLYVSFSLKMPKHISSKAKKLLEDLEKEI